MIEQRIMLGTQKGISDHFRSAIVAGAHPPRALLPSRRAITQDLGVSMPTVQRAFAILEREGFVRSDARGTFVVDYPPHRCNYGLVFPYRLDHDARQHSRFYNVLKSLAQQMKRGPRQLTCFYAPENTTNGQGDIERLVRAVNRHTLGGLIFTWPRFSELLETPVMTMPDLPRVCIEVEPVVPFPTVAVDFVQFLERALDWLTARGRKRIAIMWAVIGPPQAYAERAIGQIHRRGLRTEPYWHLGVSPHMPYPATQLTHLLMSGTSPEQRPDGIVIHDDHLVESVAAGLTAAGVRPGQDVDVVAYCNFPDRPAPHMPFRRLGYDAASVLQHCFDILERITDGQAPPGLTYVPPVFEEELIDRVAVADFQK